MRTRRWRTVVVAVVVALLIGGGLLAGCGAGPGSMGSSAGAVGTPGPTGRVRVVAAENFWGDIAAQLGGPDVVVRSIISDPNADPHLYESDAADAAAVARADVVIDNGAGYDDFMSRLLGTGASSVREVVSVQKILGATGPDVNPHFWYDIPRIPTVAGAIEAALVAADPVHRADYQANLERFDLSLRPIDEQIATIRARYHDAPVAYTERVPGYLLGDAGLTVATPVGFAAAVEDGTEPNPADTRAMDSLITNRRVRVLLYNTQTVSAVTEQVRALARRADVPVVGVSETLPSGASSYQAWQLDQITALVAALRGPT